MASTRPGPILPAPSASSGVKTRVPPPRARGLTGSVRHAIDGLLETVVRQRNMRIHMVAGILVGLVGSGIPLGLAERVTLIFCVLLVLFAEILNSALEALVDLHTEDFHERARVTKDAAAAGVLVLAIGTMAIFAAVLIANWRVVTASPDAIRRQVLTGLPLAGAAGLLVADWKRPAQIDALLVAAGLALIGLLASWTTSTVFTALTLGLFLGCAAAAWRRRRNSARQRLPGDGR
jgi:diacylglycerol kinase (ATP)